MSPVFANGASTGAMQFLFNAASQDRKEAARKAKNRKDYYALADRYHKFAADNPGEALNMSVADLETIVNHKVDVIGRSKKHPFMSDGYKKAFKNTDTFLWRDKTLVGRSFNVNGSQYTGGEISYVGVGILSAHYGHSFLLPAMVTLHNLDQYASGQGSHNIGQISGGLHWAKYGASKY